MSRTSPPQVTTTSPVDSAFIRCWNGCAPVCDASTPNDSLAVIIATAFSLRMVSASILCKRLSAVNIRLAFFLRVPSTPVTNQKTDYLSKQYYRVHLSPRFPGAMLLKRNRRNTKVIRPLHSITPCPPVSTGVYQYTLMVSFKRSSLTAQAPFLVFPHQ